MDKYIDLFCKARAYLFGTLQSKVEVFMTYGFDDPFIKHTIVKETELIIQRELQDKFPELPDEYYPKCKFKIFEEDCEIEVGVQNYFTSESSLIFLGTNNIDNTTFDYYMRKTWDEREDYMYIARYGHARDSKFSGVKVPEAEYYLGQTTPLSVAYALAVEDGFIG